MEERNDRYTEVEDRFADYQVYDQHGEKIGKVDDLFVDEMDNPEYVGVKMGFLGLSGSTLIPYEAVRVDDEQEAVETSAEKEHVKNGPSFDDEGITPEFERQVREYYGLEAGDGERAPYGEYYGAETGERSGERHPGVAVEGVTEDELSVQRTEEELRAGAREREAGSINVRKRVRTDHEQVSVPTRHEEVHVDRVPVEGREASEADIGEDEVVVPVTEEEVVVEKRPVAKEEVRVRKDVVEDEEVVEEDVRREEVEVDDETERRNP